MPASRGAQGAQQTTRWNDAQQAARAKLRRCSLAVAAAVLEVLSVRAQAQGSGTDGRELTAMALWRAGVGPLVQSAAQLNGDAALFAACLTPEARRGVLEAALSLPFLPGDFSRGGNGEPGGARAGTAGPGQHAALGALGFFFEQALEGESSAAAAAASTQGGSEGGNGDGSRPAAPTDVALAAWMDGLHRRAIAEEGGMADLLAESDDEWALLLGSGQGHGQEG